MAEEGVSVLETESYIVALVFLIFLALFVTTEKVRGAMFPCCFQASSSEDCNVYSCWNGDKPT